MQTRLIDAFRRVHLRVGGLLVAGAIQFAICVAVVAPAHADRLPVFLSGLGDWFDSTNAAQQLCMSPPVKEQPSVLKKTRSQSDKLLLSGDVHSSAVLLLSNVWTYGATIWSKDDFLKTHGVTNSPLVLDVPGSSGFYLLVANNRVLPFVGQRGQLTPMALWSWPTIPVTLDGVALKADISACGNVWFSNESLCLNGRIGRRGRQTWVLKGKDGLLELRLTVYRERDW